MAVRNRGTRTLFYTPKFVPPDSHLLPTLSATSRRMLMTLARVLPARSPCLQSLSKRAWNSRSKISWSEWIITGSRPCQLLMPRLWLRFRCQQQL